MEWKCPVCGKEFEYFGIKDFASAPKTTLFGTFKIKDYKISLTEIKEEEVKRQMEIVIDDLESILYG